MELKTYRDNGAIGAILDEYEKSVEELKEVICTITQEDLVQIVDQATKDEDCRSIQTILSHVVSCGYNYVIEIRKWLGEDVQRVNTETLHSIENYITALDKMFVYNCDLFKDYPNIQLDEYNAENKVKVRWGQIYDVEQLFEHAIVHVLRHRRQIQRFQIKLINRNA